MLLDSNGEPRIFNHETTSEHAGKEMTNNEMITFLVECLTAVFEEQGMKILKTNKTLGTEYPNFIMESRNSKLYYVLIDFSIFPSEEGFYSKQDFSEYIKLAGQFNSLPTKANVGVYCFNTDGAPAVCGGSFALKFDGLEVLEIKKKGSFLSKLFK